MSAIACMPELDLLGSVWPRVMKPQAGLPPMPAQPLGEETAFWIVFQDSWPLVEGSRTLARSSQTTKTMGVRRSGCGPVSPLVGKRAAWFLVCQSEARRLATRESAGLQRTGLSEPSRMALAASSEPLPMSLTRTFGLALWNSAMAASSQSFFSVEYSKGSSTTGPLG